MDGDQLRVEVDVDGVDTGDLRQLRADGLLAVAAADVRHGVGDLSHRRSQIPPYGIADRARARALCDVRGPGVTKTERVGAKLTLKVKGAYRITMVGQAPDDNHLKLTIK